MSRQTHVPSYRLHKQSGQAVVTLTDAVTGERTDRLLGRFNSAESRAEYGRALAVWEARGRRLESPALTDRTVAEVLDQFRTHAKGYYRDPESGEPSKEYDEFERTGVPLAGPPAAHRNWASRPSVALPVY